MDRLNLNNYLFIVFSFFFFAILFTMKTIKKNIPTANAPMVRATMGMYIMDLPSTTVPVCESCVIKSKNIVFIIAAPL